jgi:hypothetical protein
MLHVLTMNLLDHFVLQHCQVSLLNAKLMNVTQDTVIQDAKVEMNLTPRLLEPDSGEQLPSYQVSASLHCTGHTDAGAGPAFKAKVGLETVYRQTAGQPVDIAEFTSHHAGLSRQIYPMLAQELRNLLTRMGLSNIQLPFDLDPRAQNVSVSRSQAPDQIH